MSDVHFRVWKTTEARVDNEKFLECRKSVWRQIRKAPKTFSKTIQFNKSYTNAYCEKTVRDIQKIIADSFVSGQNWSTQQIKKVHWSGSLTSFLNKQYVRIFGCFCKSFRCFSDWRHTDFRHSRNFSLSTLASVVFHVRKWTALTATKLHHLKKCKMRVAARTDHPIREGCLQSSNNVHIGMSAYYAESTLNIWYKQIANGLLWTWDQEGRIE